MPTDFTESGWPEQLPTEPPTEASVPKNDSTLLPYVAEVDGLPGVPDYIKRLGKYAAFSVAINTLLMALPDSQDVYSTPQRYIASVGLSFILTSAVCEAIRSS